MRICFPHPPPWGESTTPASSKGGYSIYNSRHPSMGRRITREEPLTIKQYPGDKNLLDRRDWCRTFVDMKIIKPNITDIAGSEYAKHFKVEEFKFRWADAYGLLPRSERQRIDHHVMLTLCTYMDVYGSCHPSIEKIALRMGVGKLDTVRKSLHRLQEFGWLSITERPNHTNVYQAILPLRGWAELFGDLNRRNSEVDSTWRLNQSKMTLIAICQGLDMNSAQLSRHKDWDRLRGRVEQIISRMHNPNFQLGLLLDHVVESPPKEIHEPVGFIFQRLSEFTQTFPDCAGKRAKKSKKNEVLIESDSVQEHSQHWSEVAARLNEPDPVIRVQMMNSLKQKHQH